jgi:hypothetical protein
MKISPALLGAARSLLAVVVMAIVTWLANSANLNGVVAPAIGTIISMLALSCENWLSAQGNTALFGMVTKK